MRIVHDVGLGLRRQVLLDVALLPGFNRRE